MMAIASTPPHVGYSWRWLLPASLSIAAATWLVGFPFHPALLGIGLLSAAALIAWRPLLLFVLVPAALPVLDLAPWSGRRMIDEFDMLLLVALSVAWARLPPPQREPRPALAIKIALVLVLVSLAISTARALWPWSVPDLDSFSNPLSPFNALRLGKGAVWAVALWLLARRIRATGADPTRAFGLGMVLGLTGTVAWVLAERLAFSYLLDFRSDYRVTGPFSVMSLGGAYIECFLAVATPFLLLRLLPPVKPWAFIAGTLLLAGTSYSLMVTYSRGGYMAMVVGILVLLAATLLPARLQPGRLATGLAMAVLAAAVAYPVLTGAFAQSRLKTISADLGSREQHWVESLQIMDHDAVGQSFGMGLGRFAELNFWRGPQGERAGGHKLLSGPDGNTLRLGAGYAYFIEQIVPVRAGGHYRLSYRTRSNGPEAALGVALCQKWVIESFECTRGSLIAGPHALASAAPRTWRTLNLDIVAPNSGPGRLPRPVRLSLNNQGRSPVDVDHVSLTSADGTELIRNGSFTRGLDSWTFTSDDHLAWHTKSMPLGVYFEQGLLGLLGFVGLLLAGAVTAARAARSGSAEAAALLAALCAFTTVGFIDTLIDAPRFLMLWLLLCLLPSALNERSGRKNLNSTVATEN